MNGPTLAAGIWMNNISGLIVLSPPRLPTGRALARSGRRPEWKLVTDYTHRPRISMSLIFRILLCAHSLCRDWPTQWVLYDDGMDTDAPVIRISACIFCVRCANLRHYDCTIIDEDTLEYMQVLEFMKRKTWLINTFLYHPIDIFH